MDGINILPDARHATRKNWKQTDVICLGSNSHKVLHYETVTRSDDPCTQWHESLGTQTTCDHLESQENGSVHIRVHCHDRNVSVNKWIRDNRPNTESTNDTWHAAKNVAKEVRSVCAGPRHLEDNFRTKLPAWKHISIGVWKTASKTLWNWSLWS